jgi:hypothetical protein
MLGGQRGWTKHRDSENFKGLAVLNYGVKIAPVPLPELFPRAAGLYGRTEMMGPRPITRRIFS